MSSTSGSRAPTPSEELINEDGDVKDNSENLDDLAPSEFNTTEFAVEQETELVADSTEQPDQQSNLFAADAEIEPLSPSGTIDDRIEDPIETKEVVSFPTEEIKVQDKSPEEKTPESIGSTKPQLSSLNEKASQLTVAENLQPSTPTIELSSEVENGQDQATPSEMEEHTSDQFSNLNLQETDLPKTDGQRLILNNENETVVPEVSSKPTTTRSGIRPPSAVLRQPKPAVASPSPALRPHTTPARSPALPSKVAASPRPTSRMSRERSDVQKSTSTRSINDVGKFTPKVNVKFVNVKSKVGSVTDHKPGGGNVEIFSEKKQYTAQSKVGSLKNAKHVAGGGNVQIESRKLDFSHASPKVGSKTSYVPAKSDVKIVSEKLTWNAKSKVGSMDNAAHKPTGGNVQILSQKLNWKAESKVGSKDNISHRPGGGNVKIFDEKIRYVSDTSSRNQSQLDISSL